MDPKSASSRSSQPHFLSGALHARSRLASFLPGHKVTAQLAAFAFKDRLPPGLRPEPGTRAADTCFPASREKRRLCSTSFSRFTFRCLPASVRIAQWPFGHFVVCSSPERFLCLLRVVSGNLLHTSAPLLKPQHTTKPTVQLHFFPALLCIMPCFTCFKLSGPPHAL